MMAGKLDREIVIQSLANTVDDYGTPVETWTTFATVRAQVVQLTASEFLRSFGASSETAIIFRIRYLVGVTLAHRVSYNGGLYNLKEIKEIGRRRILELRCLKVGA